MLSKNNYFTFICISYFKNTLLKKHPLRPDGCFTYVIYA